MHDYEVMETTTVFQGRIIDVRRDIVAMPDGETSQRDVVVHPGSVAVIALDGERVLLVTQYRHPVQRRLDELPAGLLDVDGEPALLAAQRELVEEAGYEAATWNVLVDALSTPGMSDESVRIYLARDVSPCPRDVQNHEEMEMTSRWLPLSEAVTAALEGHLENAAAVIGVLAASEAQRRGFEGLRAADSPWRARPTAAPAP